MVAIAIMCCYAECVMYDPFISSSTTTSVSGFLNLKLIMNSKAVNEFDMSIT